MTKLQSANIHPELLKETLFVTFGKGNSLDVIKQYVKIMGVVRDSEIMQKQWLNYQKDFEYAVDNESQETCNSVLNIMNTCNLL